FDGVDDSLTVFDVSLNLAGNATSFGAWVKPEAGSGDNALLAFGADGVLPGSLLLYRQSTNQFIYWDSASGEHSSSAVTPDQWYHVWVTIGADNSATLYVNGDVEATFSTTARPAAGDDLLLGSAWDGSTNRYFTGLLDDVAVYDHQLNAAEIKRLYRGFEPVLLLPLDDDVLADGDAVQDLSGYDNSVTMIQLTDPDKVQYALSGAVGAGAQDMNTAYLAVEPRPYFDLSDGEFTQTAWVYPQSQPPTSASPIIGGVYDPATDFALTYPSLFITNTTQLLPIMGDGTDFYHYVSGSLLTPNAWNFVATTFDGTDYRIYINGVLRESTNAFAGVVPVAATEFDVGHFTIAGTPFNSSHLFGHLDEVAIYRQTLSAQEVAALYRQGWKRATLSNPAHSPATTSDWAYDVPDELDGSYQIQLRTTDLLGNRSTGSQGNERWAGHIGPQEIPTAVTLADFAAAVSGDSVEITWQTVSELDNTGFNLYRSQSPAAPDILLAFVPSQAPGSAQGFDYTYRDADVVGGETYWYWLEDVDVSGVATLHGPVSVAVGIPAAVTLASLQADPIPAHNLPLWLPVAFLVLLGGLAVLRRRRRGYL
ncbi:MAG: LamG domain-containing protein, partial [Anaerolineae bacterium]|nr:LamG domain-containing protein [Anaerolineae bacterium]